VRTGFSQSSVIYFSSTGDTVLQTFPYSINGKDINCIYYILRKQSVNEAQQLSSFTLPASKESDAYESLSADTIRKYHLIYQATQIEPFTSPDFNISLKNSRPKKMDKCESHQLNKFIYKTSVHVKIKCKRKIICSKKFDYMFASDSPGDFDSGKLMPSVSAWRYNDKYFIRYSIRDEQTVKCERSEVFYSIHSYLAFVN